MSREMKKVKEKFLKLNPFGLLSCILSVRRFTHGRRCHGIEDCILIKKITSGDTDALEILVRTSYQSIYLFCCRRLNGDPDTAADITQDVFLKLLENIQSVRKIGKFQNYLLTIAVNTCNNYTKKAKPLYMDLETLEDIEDTDNAFEKIELNELKAQIQYAINTLPDYQKEVIILRFYYDLKIREIATITKASVSTVKSRLQQGIKKLERYLADFRGGDNV